MHIKIIFLGKIVSLNLMNFSKDIHSEDIVTYKILFKTFSTVTFSIP